MWQISSGSKVRLLHETMLNFVDEVRLSIHCGRHFKFGQCRRVINCIVVTCCKHGKYSNFHILESGREERLSKFFQGTTSSLFVESPFVNDFKGACQDIKLCRGQP
ncbi:hypothetical protein IC582_014831 [Cucumis melo]